MRFLLAGAACVAFSVAAAQPSAAQGPVREGLRRTGEVAVQGTRAAAQGAANVARGAGQAAVGAVERTGQAAGNIVGGTAQAARAGVDRLTPNVPAQARAGANQSGFNQGRNARWRFARQNGEWWYYTPQNSWMYHRNGQWHRFSQDAYTLPNQDGRINQGQYAQGQAMPQRQEYSAGYRGVDQSGQTQSTQQVRTDAYGRQFICMNGRPVYIDGQSQFQGQSLQGQPSPTPATPQQPQEHSVARPSLDPSSTTGALEQQNQSIQASGAQPTDSEAAASSSLQSDASGTTSSTTVPSAADTGAGAGESSATSGAADRAGNAATGGSTSSQQ